MENKTKSKEHYKWSLMVFLFLFYCNLGWIYEVVLEFKDGNGFVNRGFLFGPYLPIYGFGALILILLLKNLMEKKIYIWKIPITPIIVFALIIVITSIIEYFSGYVMELVFHQRWWDYSSDFLNINGRICPRTSFKFGIGGMAFLYILKPLFILLVNKLSEKKQKIGAVIIVSVMVVDLIVTLISM